MFLVEILFKVYFVFKRDLTYFFSKVGVQLVRV
jgi:hypothetical protein